MAHKVKYYQGKSGNLYEYDKYHNWGNNKTKNGKKDLPQNEYPFKIIEI